MRAKLVTFESQLYDTSDAILNEGFTGFREDYLVLHSLIRRYKPKTFFEIGTAAGTGTNIICNAMQGQHVYSLDLPAQESYKSEQYPFKLGEYCHLPYTQLRGDSMEFDFSHYPCEGYFIDGEHDYKHVFRESTEVLKNKPEIIIYHDADMEEVWRAIKDLNKSGYKLYRVKDTRIAFLIK